MDNMCLFSACRLTYAPPCLGMELRTICRLHLLPPCCLLVFQNRFIVYVDVMSYLLISEMVCVFPCHPSDICLND